MNVPVPAAQATLQQTWGRNDTIRSEWIFETVRSTSKGGGSMMGSYRSLAQFSFAHGPVTGNVNVNSHARGGSYGMPPGMIPDEEYIEEEEEGLAAIEESEDSFDSGAATKGSEEPINPGGGTGMGIGMNDVAAHSTVIIRAPGLRDTFSARTAEEIAEPVSPGASADQLVAALGAPPAYDTPPSPAPSPQPHVHTHTSQTQSHSQGSPPTSPTSLTKRTSYAERISTRGRGTQLRAADLGNGVDTIRPVKRVDAAGSLRLSAEYVGAVREREELGSGANGGGTRGSAGSGGSGGKEGKEGEKERKKRRDESARAGRVMVDEVIVPIMQNVRVRSRLFPSSFPFRPPVYFFVVVDISTLT